MSLISFCYTFSVGWCATGICEPGISTQDDRQHYSCRGSSSMSELESLTSRATELSAKADFWNNAVLWALAITALAAVAIVVSQRLAFVHAKQLADLQDNITRIKESDAKAEQERIGTELAAAVARAKEADARIAEAQRGSAEANERATKAQESLSLAEQHSAEANAKAEGFRLDIARANERAASANETAEREKLARLQLEARLADRTLTPVQQNLLVADLRPSSGTVIDVATFGDTAEISGISRLIIESLVRAGWTVHPVAAMAGQATVRGILIGTRAGSDPAISQASVLLIKSLRAQNLSADPWVFEQMTWPGAFMGGGGVKYDAPIRMFIGSKP